MARSRAKRTALEDLQDASTEACELLKVLANPARLLLLCHICDAEYCVTELEELTGITQPTLSQQLTILRNQELVSTRRDGKQIYYRIASEHARAVLQVLHDLYCGKSHRRRGIRR